MQVTFTIEDKKLTDWVAYMIAQKVMEKDTSIEDAIVAAMEVHELTVTDVKCEREVN